MNGNFTIRGLLVFVLIVALGIGWFTNFRENERLKNQVAELRRLNFELVTAKKRLASCELELQQYARLANVELEQLDVLLDCQRRRASASEQVTNTQFQIEFLLGLADESEHKQRKLNLFNAEIGQCKSTLARVESNPDASKLEFSRAKEQLAYFESQAIEIAK